MANWDGGIVRVNAKRRKRRKARRSRRRNAPLSKAEARALRSVLRKHGRGWRRRNPLTRAEALRLLKSARTFKQWARKARKRGDSIGAAYESGIGYGLKEAVRRTGVRKKRSRR